MTLSLKFSFPFSFFLFYFFCFGRLKKKKRKKERKPTHFPYGALPGDWPTPQFPRAGPCICMGQEGCPATRSVISATKCARASRSQHRPPCLSVLRSPLSCQASEIVAIKAIPQAQGAHCGSWWVWMEERGGGGGYRLTKGLKLRLPICTKGHYTWSHRDTQKDRNKTLILQLPTWVPSPDPTTWHALWIKFLKINPVIILWIENYIVGHCHLW